MVNSISAQAHEISHFAYGFFSKNEFASQFLQQNKYTHGCTLFQYFFCERPKYSSRIGFYFYVRLFPPIMP
jgi:hypothetical protein